MSVTSPAAPAEILFSATEALAVARAYAESIAQIPQAHFLFVDVLAVHGSPAQQERLFADVLAGARLGNGLAERGGQHAQDLKTRLRSVPEGGGRAGLRLEGRKYYCTGAISARWIGVSALDDDGRLVLAFVERNAPGVTVGDDWNVMGQRATVSGSAVFDHVPVDPGLVIPYASAFEVPQQLGARSQLVHGSGRRSSGSSSTAWRWSPRATSTYEASSASTTASGLDSPQSG